MTPKKRRPTPWDELDQLIKATTSERHVATRMMTLRKALGWSQERLAKEVTAAGVPMHQSAISKIEKPPPEGRRAITVEEAVVLARVFDVPLLSLLAPPGAESELEDLSTFAQGPALKVAAMEAEGEYWHAVQRIAKLVNDPTGTWRARVEDERLVAKKKVLTLAVYDVEDDAAVTFYEDVLMHAEEIEGLEEGS